MSLSGEILSHFQAVNIKVDKKVLEKCVELCTNYDITDAEDFVDQWFAYSASHLNGAPPSVEFLEQMERKEFQKKSKDHSFKNISNTPKSKTFADTNNDDTILLDSPKAKQILTPTATGKGRPAHIQTTPTRTPQKSVQTNDISRNGSLYSSPVSQSEVYSQRTNSLSVLCTFGLSASYRRQCDLDLKIKQYYDDNLPANARYMYEILGRKALCLDSMTTMLGQSILKKHNLELTNMSTKEYTGQMTTYGRICSDSVGRLNAQSILLEGTQQLSQGHTVALNVNKLPRYALFPGQVVAVQGNNINGTSFIADSIYTDAHLELPPEVPTFEGPLEIVVACGPFTLQGNLLYEPLQDLIKYVVEFSPHVLILLGPFLEHTHEGITNGDLRTSFDNHFEQLIETVATSLTDTHIVIVSSEKDAHHHRVYPTPPYDIRENYPNVTFVPDPCLLDVNGMVIGLTTADILFHIGKEEIFIEKQPTGAADRIGRLASHVLQQQSFYPLYPPEENMSIDHDLLQQYGLIECLPHILVTPSNFRHFIKKYDECVIINPERLVKGYVAGSFARIEVLPGSSNTVSKRMACEVLRI